MKTKVLSTAKFRHCLDLVRVATTWPIGYGKSWLDYLDNLCKGEEIEKIGDTNDKLKGARNSCRKLGYYISFPSTTFR